MRRGHFPAARPKPRQGRAAPARESIAVIVIGLNVAKWLDECLASIAAQTMQPEEIVYCDDGSTDDTLAIAAAHAPRVQTVRTTGHQGMSAARMHALSVTTSTLILCIDGDDIAPPDYIAQLHAALGPNHVLAYPRAFRYFGDPRKVRHATAGAPGNLREHAKPSRRALWKSNHVSTSSLIRRADLLACGGWRDNPTHRLNDWDLALRLTARGSYARSEAVLHYRQHASNNSSKDYGLTRDQARGIVRLHAATITVATIHSGRIPGFLPQWLAAVKATMEAAGKPYELLILDDSAQGLTPADLPAHGALTLRRIHRGTDTTARRPDKHATAEFLAAHFNDILRTATTDIVWMLEDDTVPPIHAAATLLHELLATAEGPRAAVAGVYRSRHNPAHWVGRDLVDGRPQHIAELPPAPAPVHLTGTGCLMVLRDLLGPTRFAAEWNHGTARVCAHDWTFSAQLSARETPVHIVPAVVCRHHNTAESWV